MNIPSSRHLSHDYEAYKGLTLRELTAIVLIVTPLTSLIFTLVGLYWDFLLAMGCIGFLFGFILSITACPKYMAKLKRGTPHGYLYKKTVILFAQWGLKHSPYINYRGVWQKAKLCRGSHV